MDATVNVTDTTTVGPETVAIEFSTPAEFDAQPGQFVKLSATVDDEEYARFYTLSSPDVDGTAEIDASSLFSTRETSWGGTLTAMSVSSPRSRLTRVEDSDAELIVNVEMAASSSQ